MDRKIRILVVEADPSFVKMIEDSLKESGSGYDLKEVSSGQDRLPAEFDHVPGVLAPRGFFRHDLSPFLSLAPGTL